MTSMKVRKAKQLRRGSAGRIKDAESDGLDAWEQ